MRPSIALLTLAGACVGRPGKVPSQSSSATGVVGETSDTGDPLACRDVALYRVVLCAETTAVVEEPKGPPMAWVGTGTVTEVGGVLLRPPNSAALWDFERCSADHTYRVRVVDGAGDTWTMGWGLVGILDPNGWDLLPVDEVQTEAFLGSSVTAVAAHADKPVNVVLTSAFGFWYPDHLGILLMDGSRLLFAVEQRGHGLGPYAGLSVRSTRSDYCHTGDHDHIEQYPVTVATPAAAVRLRSGQQATVPVRAGNARVTVAQAYENVSCNDACANELWMAWEVP